MNVRPKKSLGQHFLKDEDVARKISLTIDASELPAEHADDWGKLPILEIGPGMGVLTKYLLDSGRGVKAVELDSESVEFLAKLYPHLNVIEGDFLKMDLATLFPSEFALIGNYPYNISSQIFFRVLDYRERIPVVSGMLQKEVAERICAAPGSRARGILSVLLQAWYDCEYLFTVEPFVFMPPPKVRSGVLRLTRNSRSDLGCDEAAFKRVVKTAFGQRRKTLRNSLSGLIKPGSELLNDPILQLRPERLSVEDFISLTQRIGQ